MGCRRSAAKRVSRESRIGGVLHHSARFRPRLLCGFARIVQHLFRPTGRAAALALSTPSRIASPAFSHAPPCFVHRPKRYYHHLPPFDIILLREPLLLWRDQPVAYLNSGNILSPSLVPPGSVILLSVNFSVS